jgi:hypothetical protein
MCDEAVAHADTQSVRDGCLVGQSMMKRRSEDMRAGERPGVIWCCAARKRK